MAVGTGAISLNEVRLEIGLGATTSLSACIAAASGTFNYAYATDPIDSLADFRGYSHAVSSEIMLISSSISTTSASACGFTASVVKYYDGGLIANGTLIYNDSGLTSLYTTSGANYRKIGAGAAAIINASGALTNFTICF